LMDLPSIFLLALALSMDAFAVAAAQGISSRVKEFHMSFSFGFFQAFMPLLGWLMGGEAKKFISFTPYIAAFILIILGVKMIYETGKMKKVEITVMAIIALSIATSIDALAAGFSLSLIGVNIWVTALIIGVTTFAISMLAFLLSGIIKRVYRAEAIGGIILLLIALRILAGINAGAY